MDGDNRDRQRQGREEERHHGILQRIEEKLDRLLGRRGGDDWREREWAPLDSPFTSYEPGDTAPRFFGGARADAPGLDPGLAGPRFDRLDVGAVGTHGVDPVSSYYGAQHPRLSAHDTAREYYILMRYLAEHGQGARYADYRRRQMDDLDRDYSEYRREQQSRFDRDFGSWRERRQGGPPEALNEPMREPASADAR